MSAAKNGGSAFPLAVDYGLPRMRFERGITVRDHFAINALKGMLANPSCNLSPDETVNAAWYLADAMLAGRKE